MRVLQLTLKDIEVLEGSLDRTLNSINLQHYEKMIRFPEKKEKKLNYIFLLNKLVNCNLVYILLDTKQKNLICYLLVGL